MSEKRFDIIYDCQGVTRLIDRENKLISLDFGFDWNDLDNYEKDKVREWLDLLNEQQATISALKEENEQLKNELRKEKSLREYSDSMYGADLIVNIRFSNGEWKADVSVIDDE